MVKTVILSGDEVMAEELGGYHCSVKNNGGGKIYASASPNIEAGADGVFPIGAGESAIIPDCNGKIYLLGTGEAVVVGSQALVNFFKSAPGESSGGGKGSIICGEASLGFALGAVVVNEVLV